MAADAQALAEALALGGLRGVRTGSAAHNAVGLAGESPVVGIDWRAPGTGGDRDSDGRQPADGLPVPGHGTVVVIGP